MPMLSRPSRCASIAVCRTVGLIALLAVAPAVRSAGEVSPWGRFITSAAIISNPITHKIYAVNEGSGSVTVIEAATGAMRTVAVGSEPIAIAVNRSTNRIYVANAGSASVAVIDGKNDTVVATVPIARLPYTLAVDETSDKVYVTHTYTGSVTVIDATNDTATSLKIGDADGIAIDPREGKVFLSTYEDPDLRILDEATGTVVKVAVGPHTWGMVFDESSSTLYLAHTATNEVVALNEDSHAIKTIPVGKIPCALAIDPEKRRLYAVNYGDDTLSIVDLRSNRAIATLPVGREPEAAALDSQANRLYVANLRSDSVTVIDGTKNAIVGTRSAGRHPYAVAIDSGALYAANYESPWVTPVARGK